MISKSALRELAKRIAHDLETIGSAPGLDGLGATLANETGAAPGLIQLFAAESARSRPAAGLLSAYMMLLGRVLEGIRFGVDRHQPASLVLAESARQAVLLLIATGAIDPPPLLLVLRVFAQARLDPGEALRAAVAAEAEFWPAAAGPDVAANELSGVAAAVDGDIFRLHAELAERFSVASDDRRSRIPAALLAAEDPRLREAVVGWLLDDGPATRAATAGLLRAAAASGAVSGGMLRRMITIRNWIPPSERVALDSAILAVRQAGVEVEPMPGVVVKSLHVSGFDGSGAQSLLALARDGARHAVLALLLKLPIGVGDAWVQTGLTAASGKAIVDELAAAVGVTPSDLDYPRRVLPHLLALGVERARPPPFGLVDVIERLGLHTINPARQALDALIDEILEAAPPARLTPAAIERAVRSSADWGQSPPFVDSWFEDDAAILAPAAGPRLSRARRLELVLSKVLPARRDWWAELMAWTALSLRSGPSTAGLWIDMALVAREVRSGRPPGEIPIMARIAAATVEALSTGR